MKKWKQYFCKLTEDGSGTKEETEDFILNNEIDLVSEKVKEAVRKLRLGKAAGRDVTSKMIKCMGEKTTQKLRELINESIKVRTVPENWNNERW